jgi:hypothetical protein
MVGRKMYVLCRVPGCNKARDEKHYDKKLRPSCEEHCAKNKWAKCPCLVAGWLKPKLEEKTQEVTQNES